MGNSPEAAKGNEKSDGRDVAAHAPATPRRQIVRPAFKAVFQFARFMITLPVVLIRGRRGNIDEVTVYSAHPSFFLWLLIVVGFVSAAIVRHVARLGRLLRLAVRVGAVVLSGHAAVRLQHAQAGPVGADLHAHLARVEVRRAAQARRRAELRCSIIWPACSRSSIPAPPRC